MKKLLGYVFAGATFLAATLQSHAQIGPGTSPYTPPNVQVACGSDSTLSIQNALTNAAAVSRGVVYLPPCPQSNPVLISVTLDIPSNTTLCGAGRGVTWIKQANSAQLAPMIENVNAGGGAGELNTNITICNLSIDGNGSNQTTGSAKRCLYLNGVSNVVIDNVEVLNCRSTAVHVDGNAAQVGPAFINQLYISGTVGPGPAWGFGLYVTHAMRDSIVSNVFVENTADQAIYIDASEGTYSNLQAKGAGTGSACTNAGTTTVDNPGGGGGSQSGWSPCPAGVYFRNVTNVKASNITTHQGNFYGVVIVGTRSSTISNVIATQNSLNNGGATGAWDDIHVDYNPVLGTGYGENDALNLSGLTVGANSQTAVSGASTLSAATTRYGLFIQDGQAGSVGDATISNAGTGYAANNVLTCSGGTQTETCRFTVTSVDGGGAITGLNRNSAAGSGVYTVLPANPVSLTGGAGASASVNIYWSTGQISNVTCRQTVTGCIRWPAFSSYWWIQ